MGLDYHGNQHACAFPMRQSSIFLKELACAQTCLGSIMPTMMAGGLT